MLGANPPVVRDDEHGTRKVVNGLLKATQRLHIQVIGRLVPGAVVHMRMVQKAWDATLGMRRRPCTGAAARIKCKRLLHQVHAQSRMLWRPNVVEAKPDREAKIVVLHTAQGHAKQAAKRGGALLCLGLD